MTVWQALLLGVLQGLTEFLPVSSSGHLVIVPALLGWSNASLVFDALVHWATLLAVLAYFWRDVWFYLRAGWASLWRRSLDVPGARVAWAIAVGSVPAALAGALLENTFETLFHSPRAAAGFLLVTAGLLFASERLGRRVRSMESITLADGLIVGLAQALAITPGISRSGATIAAGLVRGLEREAATRYSFLLGLPVIFGAGLLQVGQLLAGMTQAEPAGTLAVGFLAALVSGFLAIHGLLRFVRRHRLDVFALYCALAGLLALLVLP